MKTLRPKKKSIKRLKKEADDVFSKYIRYRDAQGGLSVCITCGVRKLPREMQNGHFVSRGASALRYDEQNCNAQCVGCNMFKSGEQYLYSVALDNKYGDGTAAKLMARRREIHRFSHEELEKIITDSTEALQAYFQYQ